jgi:membrane fusion protein (multidrug efflux system)
VVTHDALVRGTIARVGGRLDGRIASIEVRPNQRVFKGDVLVRMEDQHLKAALDRATVEVERRQKALVVAKDLLKHDGKTYKLDVRRIEDELFAFEAEIRTAKSVADRWKREHERLSKITRANVVMASEVDEVALNYETAMGTLEATQARRRALTHGLESAKTSIEGLAVRQQQLDVLAKDIELAQADLAAAEAELDSTVLRAPADGWVAERILETGGSVRVGDPVISLWVGEEVWVDAWVDESALSDLSVGSKVDVRLTAHPNDVLVGKVEAVGVVSDWEREPDLARPIQPLGFTSAPKVAVRVSLPPTTTRIMPGLSASVGIHAPTADESFSFRRAITAIIR